MAGEVRPTGSDIDLNIIRTDAWGNQLWSKNYGTPEDDNNFSYITRYGTTDDYILVGAIDTDPSFLWSFQGYIARISGADGSVLWADSVGIETVEYNESFDSNPIVLPNGDIVAIGSARPDTNNSIYAFLVKYDGNGNLLWQRNFKKYDGNSHHTFNDIRSTHDGGFIMCGNLVNITVPEQNLWVVKTDSNGCEVPHCTVGLAEPFVGNAALLVYPNPSNGMFNIELPTAPTLPATVAVYNSTGQLVLQTNTSQQQTLLNLKHHPQGLYLVKVNGSGKVMTQRILKQ